MDPPLLDPLPDEIASRVGEVWYTDETSFGIERGHIETGCASVENGNPLYWDEEVAQEITGGAIAPATMISVWFRRHHWMPEMHDALMPYQIHFDLKARLELPEAIMSHNLLEFGAPVRPGDRLRVSQSLVSISEPKRTKLGIGRFWVISQDFTNQDGERVCWETITGYGYRRQVS